MPAQADPDTRRAALEQGDPVTKTGVEQQRGILLSAAFQALRDEIRILDRYLRRGLVTQTEAGARLADAPCGAKSSEVSPEVFLGPFPEVIEDAHGRWAVGFDDETHAFENRVFASDIAALVRRAA
jgi:hypothetical protein